MARLDRSCDLRTATGWRDYAIVVVLVRLWLRAQSSPANEPPLQPTPMLPDQNKSRSIHPVRLS